MVSSSEQFITQMKLRELRKQREQLRQAYSQLEMTVAASDDAETKFRLLYAGLRTLHFANQPLHPNVNNLDVLLQDLEANHASSDLLLFWLNRLQAELTVGKTRSEFVYLFGLLLEEWAFQAQPASSATPERTNAANAIFQQLGNRAVTSSADYATFLVPLVNELGKINRERVPDDSRVEDEIVQPIDSNELERVLKHIRDDIYRPAALRSEARRFLSSKAMQRELADALTILVNDLDDWTWPASGVPAEVIKARRKWRLFLAEELPTACLLEVLGMRWNALFKSLTNDERANRLARLEHLRELNAPDVIMRNEQRLAEEAWGLTPVYPVDIWADGSTLPDRPDSNSIVTQRIQTQQKLRDIMLLDKYSGQQSTSGMETALMLINAELQLARAAFPDRPLHILKIDLKDFYNSLPHEVMFTILAEFGLAEKHINFFKRYLQVPMQWEGQRITAQRGIPNDRVLSNWLAELLLRLLDHHIQKHAPVQVIRLVDDICILSPSAENVIRAWEAVKIFCTSCGLEVNEAKSGSVCINGVRLLQLPAALPGWMMLTLADDAQWHVNVDAFTDYLDLVRQRIHSASSLLAQIEIYNDELDYLKDELAFGADLGEQHRREANQTLLRFHYALFGEGQGITTTIANVLRSKLSQDTAQITIPDSWLYWPVTAGGLGLKHAAIIVTSYQKRIARRDATPPATREPDWQYKRNDWVVFFRSFLIPVNPIEPSHNASMETLVKDFIERGSTLTSGKQKSLSPYWKWVLYTYGPQILERFGTFRFLITELVPLQLISQRRAGDVLSGDDEPTEE